MMGLNSIQIPNKIDRIGLVILSIKKPQAIKAKEKDNFCQGFKLHLVQNDAFILDSTSPMISVE